MVMGISFKHDVQRDIVEGEFSHGNNIGSLLAEIFWYICFIPGQYPRVGHHTSLFQRVSFITRWNDLEVIFHLKCSSSEHYQSEFSRNFIQIKPSYNKWQCTLTCSRNRGFS